MSVRPAVQRHHGVTYHFVLTAAGLVCRAWHQRWVAVHIWRGGEAQAHRLGSVVAPPTGGWVARDSSGVEQGRAEDYRDAEDALLDLPGEPDTLGIPWPTWAKD